MMKEAMVSSSSAGEARLLPLVLALGPPTVLNLYQHEFSLKFRFLKPWESPLTVTGFLAAYAHSVEAVFVSGGYPLSSETLRHIPSLRLVVTASAGLNHIDLPECRRRGIAVAYAGNLFSADVADMAVVLLLDVLRKISAANRYVRAGSYKIIGEFPLGSKLGGKRVGIVGLGSIGSEVAKRLESFGCIISYNSRKKKPSINYPYYSEVRDLASNADILVICCALTAETHHLVDKEVLLALGKEGVIINIARGAIIDEKEMVQFLVRGDLAGAGLDVFENEPDVPQELRALNNVVMSPHLAFLTKEAMHGMFELMAGNLEAFFSSKPLLTPVNHE